MSKKYKAADIEVLSGLEPVRRRPGMYTDTSRPNHLAHEVIDNSVDEALAGYCKKIEVTLYDDGSLEVIDDGRGMPVDIHPKEKIPGVELILTRLHAGGKFNKENYQYSGGLHGVGVSVVNALSKNLEVWIRREGLEHSLSFSGGKKKGEIEVVGKVGKANTVAKYAAKRKALKEAGDFEGLQKLPKNASPIRMHNRCKLTGRPKGYMRTFGISRVLFREMANKGLIPGVKKASW